MPRLTFFQGGDGDPVGRCAAHVVIGDHAHLVGGVREQCGDVETLPLPKESGLHLPHRTSHRNRLQWLRARNPHQELTAKTTDRKSVQADQ